MIHPLSRLGYAGWLSFGFTFLTYVLLFQRRVLLDITAQVQTLLEVCSGKVALPPTALFYVLTWLAGLGQCHFVGLMGGAVLALSFLALAKFWVTRFILEDYFGKKTAPDGRLGWLALALGWVCSLPTPDWWLHGWYIIGQPSPNYWMNGTLLASYPFALMLFWQSYRQLERPSPGWWRWQLTWMVLLALSKPGYLFVFALTYPFFLVGRHGWRSRTVFAHLWPLAVCGLLIAAEYYLVFLSPESVYVKKFNGGQISGVTFRPFEVWRLYSSNIPLSVLAGVTFPVGVAVLYWRELRAKHLFWYAWAGFVAALAVSASFMQTGAEYYTWAFRFQHYIAAYILFVISALFVWEKIRRDGYRLAGGKIWWSAGLFGLHLVSGLVYWVKMWWTKSHY